MDGNAEVDRRLKIEGLFFSLNQLCTQKIDFIFVVDKENTKVRHAWKVSQPDPTYPRAWNDGKYVRAFTERNVDPEKCFV
jgi:hypothetical protein